MYGDRLRDLFPGLVPTVEDLFLLEAHQVACLPDRAPGPELAAVLHAQPAIRRYLLTRVPGIRAWLDALLEGHGPAGDEAALRAAEDRLVWELADEIVYQRAPDMYDQVARRDWDPTSLTDGLDLDGATVVDAGAGTGLVTFALADRAERVFAVEPVATLRAFLRARAATLALGNVFVLDGTLAAIPLPAASADALITCRAIGWDLPAELAEVERVLRPGGSALHLTGQAYPPADHDPLRLGLIAAGYRLDSHPSPSGPRCRYRLRSS